MLVTAKDHAVMEAQCIYESAYRHRLTEIVPPYLPCNLPYPTGFSGTYCDQIYYSAGLLTLSSSELKERAVLCANRDVLCEVEDQLEAWIQLEVIEFDFEDSGGRGGRCSLFRTFLIAAVKTLRDALAAHNCSVVWIRAEISKPPPSWHDLNELVRANPDLVNVGPLEMFNRGFVPPVWFTAAMA